MAKFRIVYDDQLDEVVDKISDALEAHGLTIEYANNEEDDGCVDYEIVKIKE